MRKNQRSKFKTLQLSVTDIVRIYKKQLGLDLAASELNTDAQTGIDVHTLVQRKFKHTLSMETESPVDHTIHHRHLKFRITGRIDILIASQDQTLQVIEIKSCESPLEAHKAALRNPKHPHLFQASLYAWMIRESRDISCHSEVLYASLKTSKVRRLSPAWDDKDLELQLRTILDTRLHELDLMRKRTERRKRLGRKILFPFPEKRPSQGQFMDFVEVCLENQTPCIVESPTGSGKTLSALFPSLKACLAQNKALFFGTSKNSQKTNCLKTIQAFGQPHNIRPFAISLESRETLCLQSENPICSPEHCRFAHQYGRKLHNSRIMASALQKGLTLSAPTLRKIGVTYEICPFELAMDFSAIVDLVICDYNHITCPSAHLKQFFSPKINPNSVQLLFDEAHSLPDRVRSQLSPELKVESKGRPGRSCTRFFKTITKALEQFVQGEEIGPEPKCLGEAFPIQDRVEALKQRSASAIKKYAKSHSQLPFNDPASMLHQEIVHFCTRIEESAIGRESPFSLLARRNGPSTELKLLCKDSSLYLREFFSRFNSPIFMSATLSPTEYFIKKLGFSESNCARYLQISSDFSKEHRKLLIVPQLTSLFRYRQTQIPKMAETISRILAIQPVNTIVFSPSFELSHALAEQCSIPSLFTQHVQLPRMNRDETESLLTKFSSREGPQVLFAVMRGPFSEGIDLPGRSLESVIITGPPLTPPSIEETLRCAYERSLGQFNFEDSVITPAMIQVNQAIGRLIRTPTDKGTCFLLDFRFLQRAYFECIAPEWRQEMPTAHVSSQLANDLLLFWSGVTDVSPRISANNQTTLTLNH